MGFRFRKSINIGKHFRINLSKNGVGYSYGVKGYRHTVSADGKEKDTFTVPGTGISHVSSTGKNDSKSSSNQENKSQNKNSGCLITILALCLLFMIPFIGLIIDNHENKIPDPPPAVSRESVSSDNAICFEDDSTALLQVNETVSLTLKILFDDISAQDILLNGIDNQIIDVVPDTSVDNEITYNITTKSPGIVNLTASTADGKYETGIVQIIVEEPYIATVSSDINVSSNSNSSLDKSTGYYIINTNTKKIHEFGCSYAPESGSSNRDTSTTYSGLLSDGYSWCSYCH